MTAKTSVAGGLVIVALALPLAACGGSGKPAYCSDKETLQNDIKSLPSQLKSEGLGSLQSQLKKVQTDAQNLVASAKSDFPSETQAMNSSINGLKKSVDALGSSPSTQQLLALASQAQSAANSVQAFSQAASSKCD